MNTGYENGAGVYHGDFRALFNAAQVRDGVKITINDAPPDLPAEYRPFPVPQAAATHI